MLDLVRIDWSRQWSTNENTLLVITLLCYSHVIDLVHFLELTVTCSTVPQNRQQTCQSKYWILKPSTKGAFISPHLVAMSWSQKVTQSAFSSQSKYNFSNWLLENLQLSPLTIYKSVFLHRHWTHSFNDQRAHSHDYRFLQQDDRITLVSRNRWNVIAVSFSINKKLDGNGYSALSGSR